MIELDKDLSNVKLNIEKKDSVTEQYIKMLKLTKVEDQKVYLENENLKVKIVYIKKNSREETERKPSSKKIPPPPKKKIYIYFEVECEQSESESDYKHEESEEEEKPEIKAIKKSRKTKAVEQKNTKTKGTKKIFEYLNKRQIKDAARNREKRESRSNCFIF